MGHVSISRQAGVVVATSRMCVTPRVSQRIALPAIPRNEESPQTPLAGSGSGPLGGALRGGGQCAEPLDERGSRCVPSPKWPKTSRALSTAATPTNRSGYGASRRCLTGKQLEGAPRGLRTSWRGGDPSPQEMNSDYPYRRSSSTRIKCSAGRRSCTHRSTRACTNRRRASGLSSVARRVRGLDPQRRFRVIGVYRAMARFRFRQNQKSARACGLPPAGSEGLDMNGARLQRAREDSRRISYRVERGSIPLRLTSFPNKSVSSPPSTSSKSVSRSALISRI
jgi:hypothetical protein